MNHEKTEMEIQRVANGWCVRPFSARMMRDGYVSGEDLFVAMSPDQLAALIREWAVQQEKAANDR